MTPFQQFLRDVVAPTLKGVGFAGRGSTYRYLREGGHQAAFFFHQFRLGEAELEFDVDESVLVREWLVFVDRDRDDSAAALADAQAGAFERAGTASGPGRGRMRDPRAQRGDPWQFDLNDLENQARFRQLLIERAEKLVELTDPAILEDKLRRRDPELRRMLLTSEDVLLVVLLAGQHRFDEVDEFLPATADWFRADDLCAWVEKRRAVHEAAGEV